MPVAIVTPSFRKNSNGSTLEVATFLQMDPTSKRNLAVDTYGPFMVALMIVPLREKSQIIYYHLLTFTYIPHPAFMSWPFDQSLFALWPNLPTWPDI